MKRLRIVALLLAAWGLSACTSAPLPKVAHDKTAALETAKTGQISLTSGKISGSTAPVVVPVAGAFIPIPGGSSPNWVNFNAEDQALFVRYLGEELQRLNILVPAATGKPSDIALNLEFTSTSKSGNNDYTLNVTLKITGPAGTTDKKYVARAFEGEDYFTRFSVTPSGGKKMAAQKLLDAVIPDIRAAVAAL